MSKVLFIAYLFPPIANSGTQRSLKFANYLPEFGWTPIVLTVDNPDEPNLEPALLREVRNGTQVEKAPFWSDVLACKIAHYFRFITSEKRVADGLGWRIRGLVSFPDSYALWYPTAVKKAVDIYKSEGFDCIYATGFPWTSFFVARKVAKITGKPYVLDYRDLWTSWDSSWNNMGCFKRNAMKQVEKMVLSRASSVITTTDSMVEELRSMLPNSQNNRVLCITNGYDPDDFSAVTLNSSSNGKIRIAYTGVWKVGYSPQILYDALNILRSEHPNCFDRLEVVCAGFAPRTTDEYCFDGTVQELGRVPHSKAIAIMKKADVLFLPVSDGDYASGHLPGKLFEYLGAQKPIIASVPAESEVARILNRVGGAMRVDPDDMRGLAIVLVNIAQAGGPTWGSPDPSLTACFERRNLTSQLAEVLSSVSKTQ